MNKIAISLFFISAILIAFKLMSKNNNFFDTRQIISSQNDMFNNDVCSMIIFYGVPLLMSVATVCIKYISYEIVSNIVIVLSITISMLLSMLGVIISFQKQDKQYKKVKKETVNTIIFEVMLCIITLILSFIVLFVGEIENEYISSILSVFIYYLIYTITINLFIVIKRLKKLFDNLD